VSGGARVAVIGAGWIARDHIEALSRLGARLVAVCDLDEERARAAAEPVGAAVYPGADELLERERPDAVVVCTPPLTHRAVATAAFERGVHVYLEKPIARTSEDAAEIVAAAAASGVVCAVGYQWHALDLVDDLRRALAGQRVALLAGRNIGPTQSRPWFLDRAQGGGNVLERGSHHIDLQRALAGEVVAVQAAPSGVLVGQRGGDAGDIEDAAALLLRFASGAVGTIVVAWTPPGTPGIYALEVVAEEATFSLDLDPSFRLDGVSRGQAVTASARQHPFERSVQRFLEAVDARDPSLVFCAPADAAATLRVAIACERALVSGELVELT
jgi:myo-inositol 2-dehydrogenase/D-chiro-inositol 1-dehydrogenase